MAGITTLNQDENRKIEIVAETLENYARRGVFRGFSRGPVRGGKGTFRMVWHYDRVFEFVYDVRRSTMRIPLVLPDVPAASPMYTALREFVKSRHSDELPDHRRIDSMKARVQASNRNGNVSLTITLSGDDYEYAARKLIHLVHELFLTFLQDGSYYEYMVETFGLNPEGM